MAGELHPTNPWTVAESAFPVDGPTHDQLRFLVNYAVLAPSIHNTQPWLFRTVEDSIEIQVDHSRQLQASDPSGREMTISCGAALANLQLAIRRFGYDCSVQYVPDPANPDVIARVRMGRPRKPDHIDDALFRGIPRRHSERRPFQSRPVPRELQRRLIWLVSEFGCWLHFVESPPDRATVAGLVESAHRQFLADPAYQKERDHWLDSGNVTQINGSRPLNPTEKAGIPPGPTWPERDRELIRASPVLVVLGTSDDSPRTWVRAGEALQLMLLRASTENITASFLNHPCQIPVLREQLRSLTGRQGPPQALLRMGYGSGSDPSPRRPVADVMLDPVLL